MRYFSGNGALDSVGLSSFQTTQEIQSKNRRLPDSSDGLYLTLSAAPISSNRLQNLTDQLPNIFPPDVCNKIVVSLRDSSLNKYQNLFNNFKSFIHKKYGRNKKFPLLAVMLYFNYLIDKGLSYNTLKGYRAALGPVVRILS